MHFRHLLITTTIFLVIPVTYVLSIETTSAEAAPHVQESATTEPAGDNVPTLQQVTVVGQAESPLTVSNTLNQDQLKSMPMQNGSLNETLRVLPGIQFSEESRTSDNAGEILPPNISISGGRFYENNFMIDGIGNNNRLNPAFDNIDFTEDVPGHPQEVFIHPGLIGKVNVYRGNVPAKYGGFTGGVVDAKTIDPTGEFAGQLSLRHTKSQWTKIYKDETRKDEYIQPDGSVQPKFSKYDSSLLFDIPVTDNSGLLASYSQIYSRIPLYNIDRQEIQYRKLENYFLKFVAYPINDTKISLSSAYSPYEADYFLKDTYNSKYTLKNEAYNFITNIEHSFKYATLSMDLGYRSSSNKRESNDDYFIWAVTPSKPWGEITHAGETQQYSWEGGRGNLDKEQQTWEANISVDVVPFRTGVFRQDISFGLSYEVADSTFDRDADHTKYTFAWPMTSLPDAYKNLYANLTCEEGAVDCIDGEQFMILKNIFPEDHTGATIKYFDAFFEDEITWGRLSLRPGVRFSSDDFNDNSHTAPRFALSYDLFGNANTTLFAGANRYYSRALMSHALQDKRKPYEIWTRSTKLIDNMPQEWEEKERSAIASVRLTDLKTPYSDELLIGLDQRVLGGLLNITYLEREGKDEISSNSIKIDDDIYTYTEWTNDGRSSHREASLSYEWQSENHYLLLTGTWQDSESSNSTYYDRTDYPDANDDGQADPVWYRGKIVERENLPKPDYNRKYTASATYIGKLPHGFTFTNVTRYRDSFEKLVWDHDQGDDGMILTPRGELQIYDRVRQPASLIFDWRLDWEKALYKDQVFIASLEINNVFCEKVETGGYDDVYDLGRQIWLGMTYKF